MFSPSRLILIGLLACATALPAVRVVDDSGQPVVLRQPASRIVTLAPHATELLLALGLDSRLAGVADFSGYPDSLARTPRLSTLGGLDRERLLMLRPDLVVAWGSGNRSNDLRWLQRSGIPVYISEPESLAAIAASLEKLGRLAGIPRRGRQAAAAFRQRLEQACAGRTGSPPRSAYYELWPAPPMTIGGNHWLNEILARAGLRNIFADLPRSVIRISREAVLARPHQVTVIAHPLGSRRQAGEAVVFADATLGRPGPRILEGLEKLCRQL